MSHSNNLRKRMKYTLVYKHVIASSAGKVPVEVLMPLASRLVQTEAPALV
jgi:hypothetical protein